MKTNISIDCKNRSMIKHGLLLCMVLIMCITSCKEWFW